MPLPATLPAHWNFPLFYPTSCSCLPFPVSHSPQVAIKSSSTVAQVEPLSWKRFYSFPINFPIRNLIQCHQRSILSPVPSFLQKLSAPVSIVYGGYLYRHWKIRLSFLFLELSCHNRFLLCLYKFNTAYWKIWIFVEDIIYLKQSFTASSWSPTKTSSSCVSLTIHCYKIHWWPWLQHLVNCKTRI